MSIKTDLFELVKQITKDKTKAYDSTATVVRVDGDTLWVHIAGGVDETPVRKTINAEVGDTVQVRVSGGRAWVQGNETAPPTDDRKANIANTHAVEASIQAVTASETAEVAQVVAEEAKSAVSGAVTQDVLHYLATSQGSGVTTETAGWTTTVQQMTETNRYLWIYHTYVKAGGDTVDTTPVISGVYGQSGSGGGASTRLLSDYSAIDLAGQWGFEKEYFDDWSIGDVVIDADNYGYTIESENSTYWIADTRTKVGSPSVTSVKTQYYLSTSSTQATGGTWSDNITYQTGKYIWTRDVLYFESGGSLNGTAYYNKVLTDACSDAIEAVDIANSKPSVFRTVDSTVTPPYKEKDIWARFTTEESYALTGDTVIDPEKTYYMETVVDDETVYVVVSTPVASELDTYYEKTSTLTANVYVCVSDSQSSFSETDWELSASDNSALVDVVQMANEIQTDVNNSITQINETVENLSEDVYAKIASLDDTYVKTELLNAYMLFGTYQESGQTLPLLELGASDSSMKVDLRADALQFIEDGALIAYLSGRALHVQESLSFGDFLWYERTNGHLSLKCSGGN